MVNEGAEAVTEDLIDPFIDGLWLEEGLSKNTLEAYRRDLTLYLRWLQPQGLFLITSTLEHLQAYFEAQHATTKATTSNRRLTASDRPSSTRRTASRLNPSVYFLRGIGFTNFSWTIGLNSTQERVSTKPGGDQHPCERSFNGI